MNPNDDKTYWESVALKFESDDPSERGWASHVLATAFPKEEESNLARAVRYCERDRILVRAQFLADHDSDEYSGSNCLVIVERLKEADPDRQRTTRGI